MAYGGSQARVLIGAVVTGLRQGHQQLLHIEHSKILVLHSPELKIGDNNFFLTQFFIHGYLFDVFHFMYNLNC